MELTKQVIQLALVLIICGMLMTSWQPPIAPQYRCIILLTIGGALGYTLGCGSLWGVIISGLVFYKDELVREIREVKDSFEQIHETDVTHKEVG